MGRFEKNIRKRIKNETEPFDEWYQKNESQLTYFQSKTENKVATVLVKSIDFKRGLLLSALCAIVGIITIAGILSLNKGNPRDLFYGDESVKYTLMNETELAEFQKNNEYFSLMSEISGQKLIRRENNNLACIMINCELETQDDYYFISAKIEHDKNYMFIGKEFYKNLPIEYSINNGKITYGKTGIEPETSLYSYYLLSEVEGQKIYWEVRSFQDNIEDYISIVFN